MKVIFVGFLLLFSHIIYPIDIDEALENAASVTFEVNNATYTYLQNKNELTHIFSEQEKHQENSLYTLLSESKNILKIGGVAAGLWVLYNYIPVRGVSDWHQWKKDIPLEVLLEVPQEEIIDEINKSIQEKYGSNSESMIQCFNDIDKEMNYYKHYLALYLFLKKIQLHHILNVQTSIDATIIKMKRLEFLKSNIVKQISLIH